MTDISYLNLIILKCIFNFQFRVFVCKIARSTVYVQNEAEQLPKESNHCATVNFERPSKIQSIMIR